MAATSSPLTQGVRQEELRFNFLSERLSLMFCATVGERWRANVERLRTPDDLARWYVESKLLDSWLEVDQGDLERARTLREAIYRSAKQVLRGEAPDANDTSLINEAAAACPLVPQLWRGTSSLRAPAGNRGADAALSTVARDAIDLFSSPAASRIRECESDECALLFVDESRPGRRRWCSSTACGSRARTAAYRERRRSA